MRRTSFNNSISNIEAAVVLGMSMEGLLDRLID